MGADLFGDLVAGEEDHAGAAVEMLEQEHPKSERRAVPVGVIIPRFSGHLGYAASRSACSGVR
jgi:rubrerythrin